MEEKNETQDVDLENNETGVVEDTSTKEESVDSSKLKELEAEIGKLNRLLKKKDKVNTKETSKDTSESDKGFGLLEKGYLLSAGIKDPDEIELAQKLQKETGKDLDVLLESSYWKSELKDLQDAKAITNATSDVKGGGGQEKATDSPEHWIAKGVPPTREQVPDRKTRVKIHRAMMENAGTSGKKFYND